MPPGETVPTERQAERPEGFPPDRQAGQAQGQRGQDQRHGAIHPGRFPARHAGGRGGPSAAFGATVKSFDASKAKAIKGVVDVVQIPQGVAVLATTPGAPRRAAMPCRSSWDDSKAFKLGSDEILARYKEMAKKPGLSPATDRRCR
jgi:isoquinoline 1-oxidoreductase beta subunit